MTEQDISRYQDIVITTMTDVGFKVLAAIAFWVIGRWLIGLALGMIRAALEKQKVDLIVWWCGGVGGVWVGGCWVCGGWVSFGAGGVG